MPHPTPVMTPSDSLNVVPVLRPDCPRVHVLHSPNGTVTIVGVTLGGEWVAEYRCLDADFDERCVQAMERRVAVKERKAQLDRRLGTLRETRVLTFRPSVE